MLPEREAGTGAGATRSPNGFRRPWAFWLGVAAVTGGVALHVPMFLSAKSDHYMLAGMPWDNWMIAGMALMFAGYASVLYGLSPRFSRGRGSGATQLEFDAMDESRLRPAHLKLMAVLTLAVAVDTQKPFTFTFILPGVASEYNLRSASHPAPGHWPVALFPFVAIIGTVIGSLIWGRLGDSIGRRASILLAATLFIGTAMCSAMPAFHWNLVACFFMGMSAGGLLPIAYSLLAETIPAKRRGEAVVLVAGIGTALGFLLASWTAHWLIPHFGWRIMWFFGVPTGLALILLNRYIPESPRFLFANGRAGEARSVLRTFGITVSERPAAAGAPEPSGPAPGFAGVFRRPYRTITPVLTLYGLAWGLVNFGFLVWLPVYLGKVGVSAAHVTTILAKAALFAIPGAVGVAWLYGRWSTRWTLILAAALEAAALGVFAGYAGTIVHHSTAFTALLVVLLVAMWATVSALAPYAAEIYPTSIRGAGSGVVAGATKLGGVIALGIAVASWAPPGVAGAAVLAAVPAGLAALLLVFVGIETRGRRLEEISAAEQLGAVADAAPRAPRKRSLRIGGTEYPVILPSWKDPRLHLSATFVLLHTLGPGRVPLPALVPADRDRDPHLRGDRGPRHVPAEARHPLAGERAAHRERDRVHHAHPGNPARRLVDVPRRLDLRGGRRRRDGVEVPHPLPGQARLQPVERRPRPLLPDPRQRPGRAAPVLVGPALSGARGRAARDRRRRVRRALAGRPARGRGALLGHLRERARHPGPERSRVLGQLAPGPGGGRLLLEGADHLARGVHLPLVHDHRPEDGARDTRAAGGSTPSRSGSSARS